MPPKVRFDKQTVVQAALNVARRGGMEALNARAIAQEMGCSTQPLYRELRNMQELRGEVRAEAAALFSRRLAEWQAGQMPPYKTMGMAFLRFAHEEAALYRLLFLCDRSSDAYQGQERGLHRYYAGQWLYAGAGKGSPFADVHLYPGARRDDRHALHPL